jgi:hypothetical protein
MFARYLTGLALAFVLFGMVLIIQGALVAGGARGFLDHWLAFGIPTVMLLAAAVGPITLIIRRASGGRLTPVVASILGGAAGPLLLVASWLIFRERNETIVGLIHFWTRLPGEFAFGVLPHAVAGAFFAGWLCIKAERRVENALRTPTR